MSLIERESLGARKKLEREKRENGKAREVIYVTDWVMLKAGSGREGGDTGSVMTALLFSHCAGETRGNAQSPHLTQPRPSLLQWDTSDQAIYIRTSPKFTVHTPHSEK